MIQSTSAHVRTDTNNMKLYLCIGPNQVYIVFGASRALQSVRTRARWKYITVRESFFGVTNCSFWRPYFLSFDRFNRHSRWLRHCKETGTRGAKRGHNTAIFHHFVPLKTPSLREWTKETLTTHHNKAQRGSLASSKIMNFDCFEETIM